MDGYRPFYRRLPPQTRQVVLSFSIPYRPAYGRLPPLLRGYRPNPMPFYLYTPLFCPISPPTDGYRPDGYRPFYTRVYILLYPPATPRQSTPINATAPSPGRTLASSPGPAAYRNGQRNDNRLYNPPPRRQPYTPASPTSSADSSRPSEPPPIHGQPLASSPSPRPRHGTTSEPRRPAPRHGTAEQQRNNRRNNVTN